MFEVAPWIPDKEFLPVNPSRERCLATTTTNCGCQEDWQRMASLPLLGRLKKLRRPPSDQNASFAKTS